MENMKEYIDVEVHSAADVTRLTPIIEREDGNKYRIDRVPGSSLLGR